MSENQGIPDTAHIRDQPDDETRVVTLRRQLLAARREIADLRTQLDEACKDRERLDALAFDIEGSPVFDQMGDHDVHEIASADAEIETDERGAYCRAFRAAIDQARGA